MRVTSSLSALVLVMIVGSTCSKNAPSSDAATDVPMSNDLGSTNDVGQAPEVPAGAMLTPPSGFTFPEAPAMSCGGDAADCQFPPSACGNIACDGSTCSLADWIVYYDTPTCVSGQCVFTKRYFLCGDSTVCVNGGCRFNGTF